MENDFKKCWKIIERQRQCECELEFPWSRWRAKLRPTKAAASTTTRLRRSIAAARRRLRPRWAETWLSLKIGEFLFECCFSSFAVSSSLNFYILSLSALLFIVVYVKFLKENIGFEINEIYCRVLLNWCNVFLVLIQCISSEVLHLNSCFWL